MDRRAKLLKAAISNSFYARVAQWYCVSLENLFPQGSPGSIPGPGGSKKCNVLYFVAGLIASDTTRKHGYP